MFFKKATKHAMGAKNHPKKNHNHPDLPVLVAHNAAIIPTKSAEVPYV
jgi:hypothetical protein